MDLQYPVGKFQWPGSVTSEQRAALIDQIEAAPAQLRAAVEGLTEDQLDTPYRPGGWTARQVVHHVADSHMNSYLRMKFALSEEAPAVKGYDQGIWAAMPDSKAPVDISLRLIEALHERWVVLLRSMTDADFARTFVHSEMGPIRLDRNVALYAWHGRHHTAHINSIAKPVTQTA